MRRQLVIAFMVTRLSLLAVALAAVSWLPSITGPEYRHVSTNPLIDVWHRWDSGFFTQIALHGYGWQVGQPTSDVTFLPLYPLLISLPLRLMAEPAQADAAGVGVILSNICLFVALLYLDRLLALDFDDLNLRRLIAWLFLLAPATIFFSSVYTESLFFMLSLIAIYHARRGQFVHQPRAGVPRLEPLRSRQHRPHLRPLPLGQEKHALQCSHAPAREFRPARQPPRRHPLARRERQSFAPQHLVNHDRSTRSVTALRGNRGKRRLRRSRSAR